MNNCIVKKWTKYEKRWKFRDFYFNKCLRRHGIVNIFIENLSCLLFGIKGRRWEDNYPSKIATCFNDAWTYLADSEKPKNAATVEQGCYWK